MDHAAQAKPEPQTATQTPLEPQKKMRRLDREKPREFALSVIDRADWSVLGVTAPGGHPYTLPLSLVREGNHLYFHSATAGRKVELLRDGTEVSVSFVSRAVVPSLYTEAEIAALIGEGKTKLLASQVYTTTFESAHVQGRVYRVSDPAEKSKALQLLCERFTPDVAHLAPEVIRQSLGYTAIYRIEIEQLSGKAKELPGRAKG